MDAEVVIDFLLFITATFIRTRRLKLTKLKYAKEKLRLNSCGRIKEKIMFTSLEKIYLNTPTLSFPYEVR